MCHRSAVLCLFLDWFLLVGHRALPARHACSIPLTIDLSRYAGAVHLDNTTCVLPSDAASFSNNTAQGSGGSDREKLGVQSVLQI